MGGTERAEHDHVHAPDVEVEAATGPQLVVGDAFDPAEREAEQVAERVLARLAAGSAGAEHVSAGPAAVSRRAADGSAPLGLEGGTVDGALAEKIQGARGGGSPLPGPLRRTLEDAMDASLGSVRIHTGPDAATSSAAIGARAYTTGNDIFFGAGEFRPDTEDGLRTIAHEVTHTLQNSGTSVQRRLAGAFATAEQVGGAGVMIVRPVAPVVAPETEAEEKADTETAESETAETETAETETAETETAETETAGTETAGTESDTAENETAENETAETETAETEEKAEAGTEIESAETETEEKTEADTETETAETETEEKTEAGTEKSESAETETAETEEQKVAGEESADPVVSGETVAPVAAAAARSRVKLTPWDRILNGLQDYEQRETALAGQDVDAYLVARGELMRELDDVGRSISAWSATKDAEDAKTAAAHEKAIAEIRPRLEDEERLLDDGDPTEWLESLGLSEEEMYSDGTTSAGAVAPRERPQVEPGTGERDDEKVGDETGATTGEGSDELVPSEQKAAAEHIDDALSTELTAGAKAAVGADEVKHSVVADAVAALESKRDGLRAPDDQKAAEVAVVERVLAKLQVVDALAEHVAHEKDEDKTDTGDPADAAAGVHLPALELTGEDLGRAIAQLVVDDVKAALLDLLPAQDLEAALTRVTEIKDEVGAELDAQSDATAQLAASTVQGVRDKADATVASAGTSLQEIDELLADPVALAIAASEMVVPAAVLEAMEQKEYLEEVGVTSVRDLTAHVSEVVERVFEGFGGAMLRPGLEGTLDDLPEQTVAGIAEAMAAPGGPNDLIAAFVAENKVDPAQIQDVVEIAMSSYLEKSVLGSFVKQAEGGPTASAASAARTVLNSDFASRMAKGLSGFGR